MTVGELLNHIKLHQIPMDAKVFYHRIEDVYFEKHHWTTVKKEGESFHNVKEQIEKANGEYLDKEEYPLMTQELIDNIKLMNPDDFKEEYIAAECAINYDGGLYITAHY